MWPICRNRFLILQSVRAWNVGNRQKIAANAARFLSPIQVEQLPAIDLASGIEIKAPV
ncbi:hypothetical protein PFWH6_1941 [Pseudomonas fluorescens WH6]|nr:hypothetical protein PFWH6_1941 [Pseudomonas fluorescens WH6]